MGASWEYEVKPQLNSPIMSELPEIFQSDDPEIIRRMDRIRDNFARLDEELTELESVVLDENYILGLVNSQSDVIRKPR